MPINLAPTALAQVREFALSSPEIETCGFVFQNGDVIEVLNHSPEPEKDFRIAAQDNLKAIRDSRIVAAIWHSHLDIPKLSECDIKASWQLGTPYLLYDIGSDSFDYYDPWIKEPLLGREWKSHRTNCYTLVRDYYSEILNIELPMGWLDESRLEEPAYDPISEVWPHNNFQQLPPSFDLHNGDLLILRIGTANALHCAIVTDVNSNKFIHHPINQLSREDMLTDAWLRRCEYVLRFKGGSHA